MGRGLPVRKRERGGRDHHDVARGGADADALAAAFQHPHTFAHAMSDGAFTLAPHIDLMGREVGAAFRLPGSRLVLTAPPRHVKSELGSHWAPAWGFTLWPWLKVLVASHSAELATDFGREVRNTLERNAAAFPELDVRLRDDKTAAGSWKTEQGGGMRCVGVGSRVTGFGAHVIVVDDPYGTAEEAYSETQRRRVWTWFTSTLRDRTQPGQPVSILVLQQRWHEGDLAGMVQAEAPGRWRVVNLRAIAEEGEEDPLGRQPGEALWPAGYPIDVLRETEREMGPFAFGAKFQQHPRPSSGSVWRSGWFSGRYETDAECRHYRFLDGYACARSSMSVFATVDLAGSKKDHADWTAIETWGVCADGRLVLLDVARDRAQGPTTIERCRALWELWGWSSLWVEVTGKLEFVDTMRAAGLPIRTIGRSDDDGLALKGDKVAVAYAATPDAEAGRVWLPRWAPWLDPLVAELLSFPLGSNDDQADAFAWGILLGRRMRPEVRYAPRDDSAPSRPSSPLGSGLASPWARR